MRLEVVQAQRRLAELYAANGDHAGAVLIARRALAIDPYDEAVHRQLMLSFRNVGQLHLALAQYQRYANLTRASEQAGGKSCIRPCGRPSRSTKAAGSGCSIRPRGDHTRLKLRTGRWRVTDPIDIAMPPKQAATMGVPGVERIGGDEPLPKKELKYSVSPRYTSGGNRRRAGWVPWRPVDGSGSRGRRDIAGEPSAAGRPRSGLLRRSAAPGTWRCLSGNA
jgi:tetratricopeptide (TPR) repeat protein